jgi:integrase
MAAAKTKDFDTLLQEAKSRKKFDKTTLSPLIAHKGEMPAGQQRFIWDPQNPGFGLKLTPQKAVYVIQRRVTTPDGVRIVRAVIDSYTAISLEDAQEKARQQFKAMREGVDPIAEKKQAKAVAEDAERIASITLQQVLDDYLRMYPLRAKTQEVYRNTFGRCFGTGEIKTKKGTILREAVWESWLDLSITDIDEDMVVERQLTLSNANGPRGKGEAQANQAMRVLRTLFNFAIEHYKDMNKQPIVVSNPVRALKTRRLWNENVAREDVIEDEQLGEWYKAVSKLENETIRDFLVLCLLTGLRRSEAAKLKWDRIRLKGDKPILVIPKEDTKIGVEHRLPLSDVLVDLLERRSKVRDISNKYVFPGEKPGTHIVEPKGVIAKVVEQSKVPFSCHTLRRTFGTIASRLDIAYAKHKKLMAHSTKADVTAHHYTRLTEEDLREPMQKITDHIKQHAGIKLRSDSATFKKLASDILDIPTDNRIS